jgi:hypothetical protein
LNGHGHQGVQNYTNSKLRLLLRDIGSDIKPVFHADVKPDMVFDDVADLGAQGDFMLQRPHLVMWVERYRMRGVCGRGGPLARKQRLGVVRSMIVSAIYSHMFFRPHDDMSLLRLLVDRWRYRTGHFDLVNIVGRPRHVDATLVSSEEGDVDGEGEEEDSDDEGEGEGSNQESRAAKSQKSRLDQLPDRGQQIVDFDKQNKMWIGDRAIFAMAAIRFQAGVSAKKMLLVQYLMDYITSGEVADPILIRKWTMQGEGLNQRIRRLDWREQNVQAQKITDAPGMKYMSADATEINQSDVMSRHIYYFDLELMAPNYRLLANTPIGGKSSQDDGQASFNVFSSEFPEMPAHQMGGGPTDNAPQARSVSTPSSPHHHMYPIINIKP